MKPTFAAPIAGLVAGITVALTGVAHSADPFGTYMRPSTGSHVQFYDCGGALCGKVVKATDPSKQATVGKVILNGAKKSGDNTWKGNLLSLDDGNTYAGTLTLLGPKEIKLEGCTLAVLCKSETWKKIN